MKKFNFNLRMFDGEGAVAGTGAETGGATTETVADNTAVAEQNTGKQVTTAVPEDTTDERTEAYEKFKEDYKDFYQKDVQKVINKRFKDTKVLEETNAKLQKSVGDTQPLIDTLMSKYGVKDFSELQQAIEEDESFFENAALKQGLDVETYKKMYKLEQENASFKAAKEQMEDKNHIDQIYNQWLTQAEEAQRLYPNLDLETECGNETFLKLLQAGVGVKAAYESVHIDDIVKGVAGMTAQEVQSKVVNNVKSRASRPPENGTTSHASATVKTDVSKMSKSEMDDIIRRVQRGEKITL